MYTIHIHIGIHTHIYLCIIFHASMCWLCSGCCELMSCGCYFSKRRNEVSRSSGLHPTRLCTHLHKPSSICHRPRAMRRGTLRMPAHLKHYVMALYRGYHFCMHDPEHTARRSRPHHPDRRLPHTDPPQLYWGGCRKSRALLCCSVPTSFCLCSISLNQLRG